MLKPSNVSVMWPQKGNETPCVGVLAENGGSLESGIVFHSHTREIDGSMSAESIKRYHPFHDDHGTPILEWLNHVNDM